MSGLWPSPRVFDWLLGKIIAARLDLAHKAGHPVADFFLYVRWRAWSWTFDILDRAFPPEES